MRLLPDGPSTKNHPTAETAAARLAAIVASSEDAIIGKDLSGLVTSWNAAAEKIFGYSAAEMIGQPIRRLIPPERQSEEDEILGRIRQGENVRHFETERRAKDGRLVAVSVTVSAIRDSAGHLVGASKIARDISETKGFAAALRASNERYRALFEYAPDGILIADPESNYLDANASICRMLGRTREELIGLHASDIVSPAERPHIGSALADIKATSEHHREWQFRRKDGSVFAAEVIAARLPDGNLLGMVRDITERKEAERDIRQLNHDLELRVAARTADLEAANRELEAFSYSVSHDLRAPLRAVDGFAQAVLEDFGPQLPAEGQWQLGVIRESAQRMGELIDDLLAFSRLSRQPLRQQSIDSNALVRGVLADLQAEQAGRHVQIDLGDLPPCEGDPALLRQVWLNLLANALKYSRKRDPAVVEIGCRPDGAGRPAFFVRDNGTGFDMRYADKLFRVFQRLHRAEDYEGTGVGLAIVQRIVHRHGGRVWAEAAVDRGATFSFTVNAAGQP
jgi:PAS domain S-box-containing protein